MWLYTGGNGKISEISGLTIGEILTYSDYHNVDSPTPDVIGLFRSLNENDLIAMSNKRPKLSATKFYEELLKDEKFSIVKEF